MKSDLSPRILKSEIQNSLKVLDKLEAHLIDFRNRKLSAGLEYSIDEAMVLTQSLSSYYTCLETIFLRISSFFENDLVKERWHQDLLEKMTLEIDGIRPRVISDEVYKNLVELLKFRHFTRYYYELNYDWDKLKYLLIKFDKARERVKSELDEFIGFLSALIQS